MALELLVPVGLVVEVLEEHVEGLLQVPALVLLELAVLAHELLPWLLQRVLAGGQGRSELE